MLKKISLTIAAGALALMPSLANAYTGVLLDCFGSVSSTFASVSPGLTCQNKKNVIKVKSLGTGLFNCSATAPPANWDTWKARGIGSKLTTPNSVLIAKADIALTAVTNGSCNLGGDGPTGDSSKPYGTGTVTFRDAGGVKVKDAVSKFSARIAGDLVTSTAQINGIVTAGPGAGGTVIAQVPLDITGLLADDANARLFQCGVSPGPATYCASDPFGHKDNDKCTGPGTPVGCSGDHIGGLGCRGASDPYPCCTGVKAGNCVAPVNSIPLVTGGGFIKISYDSNYDCTADSTPYTCCTGSGTGKCN